LQNAKQDDCQDMLQRKKGLLQVPIISETSFKQLAFSTIVGSLQNKTPLVPKFS
jgi:hypothetical protein